MGDTFEPLDNGHILIKFNNQAYDLRPPIAKDYWALRESVAKMYDDIAAVKDDQAVLESDKEIFALEASWVLEALTKLSDPPFIGTVDDLPIWIIDGKMIRRMTAHWISVPLDLPGN